MDKALTFPQYLWAIFKKLFWVTSCFSLAIYFAMLPETSWIQIGLNILCIYLFVLNGVHGIYLWIQDSRDE